MLNKPIMEETYLFNYNVTYTHIYNYIHIHHYTHYVKLLVDCIKLKMHYNMRNSLVRKFIICKQFNIYIVIIGSHRPFLDCCVLLTTVSFKFLFL